MNSTTGRASKGAASEWTKCSRCQARIYFNPGSEHPELHNPDGTPHARSCQEGQRPRSVPADPGKSATKTAAPRKLISMVGEDLMLVHPSGGGSLELRRDEAPRWVLIGKAKRDLGGIPLTHEELTIILGAMMVWSMGVHPLKLAESIGAGQA